MSARHSFPLLLKSSPSVEGIFDGYASTFNGPPDSYGDVVAPGAFAASLAAHEKRGSKPALLWAHDMGQPVGVPQLLKETDRGLQLRGKLAMQTPRAREAIELMQMGALGLSIGYRTLDDEALPGGGRLLKSVELVEISLVSVPANPDARITEVKSAALETRAGLEHALREQLGLSSRQAKKLVGGGWAALTGADEPPLDQAAAARIGYRLGELSNLLRN